MPKPITPADTAMPRTSEPCLSPYPYIWPCPSSFVDAHVTIKSAPLGIPNIRLDDEVSSWCAENLDDSFAIELFSEPLRFVMTFVDERDRIVFATFWG